MPHEHVMDLRVLAERVIGREDGATRIAEDGAHTFTLEALPNDLAAGFLHRDMSLGIRFNT